MDVDPYDIELLPPRVQGWFKQESQRNLRAFINQNHPEFFVELGSWLGESSILIAQWLPPHGILYCIDTWEGSVEHKTDPQWSGYLPTLYRQFISNVIHAGQQNKIKPIRSMTTSAVKTFLPETVGVVFIDASHEYQDVLKDCKDWWPILKPDGIMCGDDYDWPNVKKAVDEFASIYALKPRIDIGYWEIVKL